jgi:hypothetical protein
VWPAYIIYRCARAKKIQEIGLLNALATTELRRAMRLALDSRDQEKISVSLAWRSNGVCPFRFDADHFSRMPDKKSRRLAGFC